MGSDIERTANIVVMAADALANNQKRTTRRLGKEVALLIKRHNQLELRMVRIIRDFKGERSASYREHLLAFDFVCDMTESARAMVETQQEHLANLHARPNGSFLVAYADLIALSWWPMPTSSLFSRSTPAVLCWPLRVARASPTATCSRQRGALFQRSSASLIES
ncbi:MAG: hypothetical protein RL558_1242 [Bacteroidota bacterium]